MVRGAELFSGADGNGQPILAWRERANVGRIVDAGRIVGLVEVQIVQASRRTIEIEKPPAMIRLGAVRQVTEWHE